MQSTIKDKIKVYCPTHQSVFDVDHKPQITCEIREHALAVNFPYSEFWEYCCDCQTFSPSRFGTGGKVKDVCSHCNRPTTRRFLCGECKTVSYDSDENTKGKTRRVNVADGIAPSCPSCGETAKETIHPHDCADIEGLLLTERSDCPFCQKAIVSSPPLESANVLQTDAAKTVKSNKNFGSTQCPKCGNWGIAERIYCGKCGIRINDLGENVASGSAVPRTQLFGSICPNCGAGNPADSSFCNNCGQALRVISQVERLEDINIHTSNVPTAIYTFQSSPSLSGESSAISPPAKSASSDIKTIFFVIGGLLFLGAIIGTLVVVNNNNRTTDNSANSNTSSNNAKTMNSTNANRLTNSNSRVSTISPTSSEVGRIGRLTTNVYIRSASNKNAEIIGTHYENARVEILETDSYNTSDGYSTWYRVKVLQDGCDQKEGKGCGNNWERSGDFGWMQAAKEGWMNAKNIVLE